MIPWCRRIIRHLQKPIVPSPRTCNTDRSCQLSKTISSFRRRLKCIRASLDSLKAEQVERVRLRRILAAYELYIQIKLYMPGRVPRGRVYNVFARSFLATIFPQGRCLKRAAPALYVVFCSDTKYPGGKHSVITGNNRCRPDAAAIPRITRIVPRLLLFHLAPHHFPKDRTRDWTANEL